MGEEVNQITFKIARDFVIQQQLSTSQIKDYIYRVCWLGEEYDGFFTDTKGMSKICRYYRITEYGNTKIQNPIWNVFVKKGYGKYEDVFDEAFDMVFKQYPYGLNDEKGAPTFFEVLDRNIEELRNPAPKKQKTIERTEENERYEEHEVSYTSEKKSGCLGTIIKFIIVLVIIIIIFKSCAG